jgi:hypothetical protein
MRTSLRLAIQAANWSALWTLDDGIFNSRTVPTAKPFCLELLDLNGASVDGRWRGCHPALGQLHLSARPDAALTATSSAVAQTQP